MKIQARKILTDVTLTERGDTIRSFPVILALSAAFVISAQTVAIPGGRFIMGGTAGEDDEQPPHPVSLDPFRMDKHEVSFEQYDSCVRAGVCTSPHYEDKKCLMWTTHGLQRIVVPQHYRAPQAPVVCVDLNQARSFCSYRGKRLPTEAEWEYAALAGGSSVYAWGDNPPGNEYCAQSSDRHAKNTGSFRPNAWGLTDMTGNVWEWTSDRYQRDYYTQSPESNPRGPDVGRYHVIRGGGWYSSASQLRIKNRHWFVAEYGEVSLGFRCISQ